MSCVDIMMECKDKMDYEEIKLAWILWLEILAFYSFIMQGFHLIKYQ